MCLNLQRGFVLTARACEKLQVQHAACMAIGNEVYIRISELKGGKLEKSTRFLYTHLSADIVSGKIICVKFVLKFDTKTSSL
jgi:hypothetical protein